MLSSLLVIVVSSCGERQERRTEAEPSAATEAPDTLEYVARGNEPFWAVKVTAREIVFQEPENIEGTRGDYAAPTRDGTRRIFRTTLRDSAGTPLELTLDDRPCQDSMSGFSFPYTATVRIGDRVMHGCGESRAPGDTLRREPR